MSNMQQVNKYIPDYLVTPGEVLEDYLEYAGITQSALADRTGLSKRIINEIIKSKTAITAEIALKFERTLGRPAHFWSNLEQQYQEDKTRLADKINLEKDLHCLDIFPVGEMVKLGWIEKFKEKSLQLDALLRFFAVASPAQLPVCPQADFRITESYKTKKDAAIISAWLRKGEIDAKQKHCALFDRQKFKDSLVEIRKLTIIEEPKVFVPRLESICASCGVAVVFVPALTNLGIHGATRWIKDKYIMQLSLYLKSNDNLWFTVFHEAYHIINNSRKELYVEENTLENENETENKANTFACDILIPPKQLTGFLSSNYKPTLSQIERFAADIGIAPGIVVGRLQHDRILSVKYGNNLKVRYHWT